MKRALIEFTAPTVQILTEDVDDKTGERTMRVAVKWQHAGIINGNGRRYPKEVMTKEMARLKPMMAEGRIFGASYHPKGDAEVDDVSHIWESIEMEEDGSCVGIVKVLPTDRGRNAQVIIKNGGRIGMSSRGFGSTTKKEEVVNGKKIAVDEINPDYTLKSPGDFVLTPSVPDAGTRHILESRFSEAEDSGEILTEEKDMVKEYKTIEELRADHTALLKPLDDELATVKEQVKTLGDQIVQLEAEKAEALKAVEAINEGRELLLDEIREAITAMSEIDGVIPADIQKEGEEPPAAAAPAVEPVVAEPAAVAEPAPAPAQELIDMKKKADEEKARADALEAELANLKKAKEDKAKKDAEAAKVKEAFEAALAKETAEYKPLIEKELVKDGEILIESAEAVEAKVNETRTKISGILAEAKKQEIKKTGIEEKGRINPNGPVLNEAQITARYLEAVRAGFKGDEAQYARDVLNISKS